MEKLKLITLYVRLITCLLLHRNFGNSTEVLNSKALTDSVISYVEFALMNNAIKGYNDMKEEIKNLKTSWKILVYS